MVMLGHFLGVLRYTENFPINDTVIRFLNADYTFFLDESFWLYMFFIISGYLLVLSPSPNLKSVVVKCIKRFFRLGLPILFAYIIIFVIYKTIGFHNGETTALFQTDWYQSAYGGTYTLTQVIRSPIDVLIFGAKNLNAPYWVLRDMFFVSLYFFLYSFIRIKFLQKPIIRFISDIVALCLTLSSKVAFSCFFGVIIAFYEPYLKKFFQKSKIISLAILFMLSVCYMIKEELYFILPLFASLLLSVQEITSLFDKSKLLRYIGKISFGIYSFHWPIFCSAGALLIIELCKHTSVLSAYIVTFIFCIILSFILAIIYNLTAEKWSTTITQKITQITDNILDKFFNIFKKIRPTS